MNKLNSTDFAHGEAAGLEELIDRESLGDVCRSFFELFGLSIRIFSSTGALLANIHKERSICRYINGLMNGRIACTKTVSQAQQLIPKDATEKHSCFTGAIYQIVPITYDDRPLGRIILGPFLPADVDRMPESLVDMVPQEDLEQVNALLGEMPRVRQDTAVRIGTHLRATLDLILFAGHKAQLTSDMHLASVRESYRELAEKNTKLQDAYNRLKELDRLKSNFLATVSHELRTPLTSIIGYSDMLISGIGGTLNEEQTEFVETIRSKGDLLLSLILNLLDLNRLEKQDIRLDLQQIQPEAILFEIMEMLLPEASKNSVQIKVECEGQIPGLQADPVRLKQILMNLASNAVKFSPKNSSVILSARSTNLASDEAENDSIGAAVMMASQPAVQFVIQDHGIGMPESELDRIFDAFYQIDSGSTREYGGIGLGLSIAKKLVDAHAGEIRVESKVKEGTTFYVTFPEQLKQPT